jgi:hypothetical protein
VLTLVMALGACNGGGIEEPREEGEEMMEEGMEEGEEMIEDE